MKLLLIAAYLVVASEALTQDFVEKVIDTIRTVGEECLGESSATKEDIMILLDHKIPDSYEGKCLLFCFHKRFKIQKDDGTLDKDNALKALDPLKENDEEVYNKVLKIFDKCGTSVAFDKDPCVYSANLAECAISEGKAMKLDDLLLFE